MSKDEENTKAAADAPATPDPLAQLKAEELAVILKPINTFLTALQAPGANLQTVVAGAQIVQLEELANIPAIESIGIGNVALALQQKLNAWAASATGQAAS